MGNVVIVFIDAVSSSPCSLSLLFVAPAVHCPPLFVTPVLLTTGISILIGPGVLIWHFGVGVGVVLALALAGVLALALLFTALVVWHWLWSPWPCLVLLAPPHEQGLTGMGCGWV
jgi:hypothetical protein